MVFIENANKISMNLLDLILLEQSEKDKECRSVFRLLRGFFYKLAKRFLYWYRSSLIFIFPCLYA